MYLAPIYPTCRDAPNSPPSSWMLLKEKIHARRKRSSFKPVTHLELLCRTDYRPQFSGQEPVISRGRTEVMREQTALVVVQYARLVKTDQSVGSGLQQNKETL